MITKNVSILWGWEKTHNTYAGRYQGWKKFYREVTDEFVMEFLSFMVFYGLTLVSFYICTLFYFMDYANQYKELFLLPFCIYGFLWLIGGILFLLILPKIYVPYLSKHDAASIKV
ncbi:MAG: hypothetical protein L6408_04295 [Nanoarchaeota archaeon]|nr:hypothetical protein [Nanoarchaeota archaeon]